MTGKVKNCPVCGRLFSDTGLHVCLDCYDKLQKKEAEVVNFVRDNPNSTVVDIVKATNASEAMIKKMIREGRFVQIGVKMTYPCEKCGAPITTGRICNSCMESMRADLQKQSQAIVAARQASGRRQGMYSRKNIR